MSACGRCRRVLVPGAAGHGWYGERLACSMRCGAALQQRVGAGPYDDDDDEYDDLSSVDYSAVDDDDMAQLEREQRQATLVRMKPGVMLRTRDASFDYVAQVIAADGDGLVTARALLRRELGGARWVPLWDEQFLQALTGDDYGTQIGSFLPLLPDDSDELVALRAAYAVGAPAFYHNPRTDRVNACRVVTPPDSTGMLVVGHLATADALALAYVRAAEERVPAAAVAVATEAAVRDAVHTLRVQSLRERDVVVAIMSTQPELTSAYEQVETRNGIIIRQRESARELATVEMSALETQRQVGFSVETDRIHLWGWWDAEADTLRLVHLHVPANADEFALTVHMIDTAEGAREPDDYWFAQRAAAARGRDGGFVVLVWGRRVHRVFYAPPALASVVHLAQFEYNVVPARHTLVRVGDWVGRVQALPLGLDARTEAMTPDEACAGGRVVDTCPRVGVKSSADLSGRVRIEWLGTVDDGGSVRIGLRDDKPAVECVTACGVAPLAVASPEYALFVRTLDKDRAARVDAMLDQVGRIADRLRRAPLPLTPDQTAESAQAETLLARVFDTELIAFYTQPEDLVRRSDEVRLRMAAVLRAMRFGGGGAKRTADSTDSGAKRTLASRIGRCRLK